MNKVHGKTIFTQNGFSIQKLLQETCFLQIMGSFFLCRTHGKKKILSQSVRSTFAKPCAHVLLIA
jgi:hypothetical protein